MDGGATVALPVLLGVSAETVLGNMPYNSLQIQTVLAPWVGALDFCNTLLLGSTSLSLSQLAASSPPMVFWRL